MLSLILKTYADLGMHRQKHAEKEKTLW